MYGDNLALSLRGNLWVGMIHHAGSRFREGEKGNFGVVLINSGRTPALQLNTAMFAQLIPANQPIEFTYGTGIPLRKGGRATLQPGMETILNATTDRPMTKEQIEAMKSGMAIFYIYGRLSYQDIFKRTHHGTFCIYVDHDLVTTQAGPAYNYYD